MEILSQIPGRIRIKEKNIYNDPKLCQVTNLYLNQLQGVIKSKSNPVIGTISITYDPNKVTDTVLVNKIKKMLSKEKEYLKYLGELHEGYIKEEERLHVAKKKMLIFGSIYVAYKIKQHFFGKFFINRHLPILKIAAAVTIIKGYPQLKKTYTKLTKYFPTDSDKLLLVAGTALTLSREGNKGTMLLFLKAFTDALDAYFKLQIQKTLLENQSNPDSLVWFNHDEGRYLMPLQSIEENDLVSIYQKETIMVEGVVTEGEALVNHIYYSGQPDVKRVKKGSRVEAGMVVILGDIKVKVTKIPQTLFKEDLLLKSLRINQRTTQHRERALYLASIMALGSYFITGSTLAPLSVFLLMTPSAAKVAQNAGLSNYLKLLLKNKILLRNVNTIEKILEVNSVVFDKTGTLTKGRLRIAGIESLDRNYSEEKILEISSACESNICHPVAQTLTKAADIKGLVEGGTEQEHSVIYIPSEGIISDYEGHKVVIGSKKLMAREKVKLNGNGQSKSNNKGFYLIVYVAVDGKLVGKIYMVEELEHQVKEMISSIKDYGIEDVSIISGDLKRNVAHLSDQLGITCYQGELSNEEKGRYINKKQENSAVAMIGDGINDLPALEKADVSISFVNQSCQQAKHQSDCLMLEKDMMLVPRLLELTEKSYYRINRNVDFTQNYNFVLGLLAMMGYIRPFKAKSLNTVNSIVAIMNSMRILRIKPNRQLERGDLNEKTIPTL
ncbi:HAD-IC family P-type ATPase [Alkaliphilus hydrothermalis]|uniref:Cd(2+)-exporting ATPase n=1 Tax=Alkaliphilus hydrothermalis TaxID=1482730 RepID=A0ABS2NNC2_9FIRM|nr:HAD-IC family P-type ATPase [Alkaliphilus hydrothermalis]MBM7614450.1 cation-transporting P-type ATPase C [Alkaliphilus hydrothermalis]